MMAPLEDDRDWTLASGPMPCTSGPKPARELLPLVYEELRRLAAQRLARRLRRSDPPGHGAGA